MARLINFNMTIYYTAMNKNAELENLAREISALPRALETASRSGGDQAVILARMVRGITLGSWREATTAQDLKNWYAFPVQADDDFDAEDMSSCESLAISPFREVQGALTKGMFAHVLHRELIRLSRNGGSLSLVSASLAERSRLATALGDGSVKRLEAILGSVMLKRLEDCDSLGILRKGQYICCLPGLGQLAARNFAEKTQADFEEAARPFFPTGGITAGQSANCALGIVNILQGENSNTTDLLKRVKTSLELALARSGTLIHQETSSAPLENTTLVQSSEKRFLFFGGNPS